MTSHPPPPRAPPSSAPSRPDQHRPPPVNPAPITPTIPSVVAPHSHSGLSPTEAKTLADWTRQDIASGKSPLKQPRKSSTTWARRQTNASRQPIRDPTSRNLLMNSSPWRNRKTSSFAMASPGKPPDDGGNETVRSLGAHVVEWRRVSPRLG